MIDETRIVANLESMQEGRRDEKQQPADARGEADRVLTSNVWDIETEKAATMRRERHRHRTRYRLQLFQFNSSQYLDAGGISAQSQQSSAMHWEAERIVRRGKQSPLFSKCSEKGRYSLSLLSDPPSCCSCC